MASNAWWVLGSSFKIGDGATPEAFTAVAEVMDIDGPSMTRDSIEVTNQSTSSDGWREFIAGFRDGDTVTITANWLPTDTTHDGNTGLWEQFNDDDNHNYQIVLPTAIGLTIAFAGHLVDFPPTLPLEEQAQIEFGVKVSGAVTIS